MNFEFIANDYYNNIFLIIFYSTLLIQLIYFWFIFSKLAFYKKKKNTEQYLPVSVVICAKNEYYNLEKNLPLILEQDYPNFEVVVVNDTSDDETDFLLMQLSKNYPNLKTINFYENVNFFKGKKFPLSIGIRCASYENIILTDADCKPMSNQWIKSIQNNFSDTVDIVLGYGKIKEEMGILNSLIRFDTLSIALTYFSFALIGKPYMGVGRNLAYKRELFYKNKGFISHYKIKSGDDDLFINKVAKKNNTAIEITHDSQTVSYAKRNFSDWISQKRRHYTTGKYYKFSTKFNLGLFSVSQYLFFITFAFLLIRADNTFWVVLSLFIIRLFSQLFIYKKVMLKLGEKNLLLAIPFYEIFFMIFNPIILILNSIRKPNKWK